jgi:omega-6 fatty acid desaturase (delta-12 desaturase)
MCQVVAATADLRNVRRLTVDPKDIRKHVLKYARCDDDKAWRTVMVTVMLYAATLFLFPVLDWRIWVLFRGLVYVRTFVVFHDCCHGSLFQKNRMNYVVGKIAGALAVTPFEKWRRDHIHHHHVYGTEGIYDSGLTVRWTDREWEAFPLWKKAVLRLVRDPLVFLWFLPFCKFFVQYRFVGGGGAAFTNVFKSAELILLHWMIGAEFLRLELLGSLWGAGLGVLLFHLQVPC